MSLKLLDKFSHEIFLFKYAQRYVILISILGRRAKFTHTLLEYSLATRNIFLLNLTFFLPQKYTGGFKLFQLNSQKQF